MLRRQRTSPRPSRSHRRLTLLAILIIGWPVLAWVSARALMVESRLPQADAIVVLAGSSTYIERAELAARLFHEGRALKVVLTNDNLHGGWSVAEQRNPLFVELATAELKRQGVPAERIEVVPGTVASTYEEAVALRQLADRESLRSIIVVTSAYQSRRALWTLHRVFKGSDVLIGLEAPPPGQQTPTPAFWWWHGLGWKTVPGEYLKLVYYLLRY